MYKIVSTPDPILTNKSEPVKNFDKKLDKIIKEMSETLLATVDPIGVGLAAPQVGLPIRLFLAKPTEESEISVFANPVIESAVDAQIKTGSKKKLLEGCLSIPNIWGNVTRKKSLTLSYQDETGQHHRKTFSGFTATIIQHEIDHLDGILFTKRVMEQNEKLYKSHKNEKGEDEFDEIKI